MFISEIDRLLLTDHFITRDLLGDDAWLLRNLPKHQVAQFFGIYYLKMHCVLDNFGVKSFIDLFLDHTGIQYSPNVLGRWLRLLQWLENEAKQARASFDLEKLSQLKLGKYRHDRQGTNRTI